MSHQVSRGGRRQGACRVTFSQPADYSRWPRLVPLLSLAGADGNSYQHAIMQLLDCCNITAEFTPTSEGGKEAGNRRPTDRSVYTCVRLWMFWQWLAQVVRPTALVLCPWGLQDAT